MIKISNGINVIEVTRGAYEGVFKNQGYIPFEEDKRATEGHSEASEGIIEEDINIEPEEEIDENEKDKIFIDSIVEIPISKWSKDEVKNFARIKGIELPKTKDKNEIIEVIKKYI